MQNNYAQQLINDGAEIIDIGAEATGPAAATISPEEEWQRLEPILAELVMINTPAIKPKIRMIPVMPVPQLKH